MFDFFSRTPSKDQFAQLVLAEMKRSGAKEEWKYEAKGFMLTCGTSRIFLDNSFAEYCQAKVLDWGTRYIAWARSFPDRESLPFFGATTWARRLLERAVAAGRRELALSVAEAVLTSHLPLERERHWWQKQRYQLVRSSDT